jgi:hypothetical protein
MIEALTICALGFVPLRACCQWSSFHVSMVAQSVSPFRIEASGRDRLRIHKD